MNTNNKSKDILILGKRHKQGSDNTTLTAEAEYSINFSISQRNFVIMETIASYLLMVVKYTSLKQMILK